MNKEYKGYEKFDGCYGKVTGRCRAGAFLTLDNGQDAFAYKFANLISGTKVLCTVLKLPSEEKRMLVSIDSVYGYEPLPLAA